MKNNRTDAKLVGAVMVGPLEYSVFEEGDGDRVYRDNGDEVARIGLCEYIKCEITVHEEMSLARKRATLAHELCHAHLQWFHAQRGEWDEEDVCGVMEAYAEPIMRDVDRLYPKGGIDAPKPEAA